MDPSNRTGGKPLLWALFGSNALTPGAPSPASSLAWGFMSLLTLSAPGRGMFWGWLGEFPGGAAPGADAFPGGREQLATSSLPALALRLAPLPAAFHCRLFIRLNSLRFLSCSLRGTEGELVPADGPHPPHPAPLERGLEKRDAGEGGSPTPAGPPRRFPANTVRAQPKNASLIS